MPPRFDKSDGELLYVQVSDFVREKIYSKDWGVDEPIPSEHELMEMLHLSRGTVQKGIRQLVDEGLLVQQRGRGTFVVQPTDRGQEYLLIEAAVVEVEKRFTSETDPAAGTCRR